MANQHSRGKNQCNCPWCEYERRLKSASSSTAGSFQSSGSQKNTQRPINQPTHRTYTPNPPSQTTRQPQPATRTKTNPSGDVITRVITIILIILALVVFVPKIINTFDNNNGSSISQQTYQTDQSSNSEVGESQSRIVSSPTEVVDECAGTPETRMSVGMLGRVTYRNNVALILRSSPEISKSTFIKDLAEGTRITVIDGPVCAEGFVWWRIRTREGAVGWSAEGTRKEYYMEPFDWSDED